MFVQRVFNFCSGRTTVFLILAGGELTSFGPRIFALVSLVASVGTSDVTNDDS